MVDYNMTIPLGIIKKLNTHIHGIPYIATFTVFKNSVVDLNNSMLLGKLWLRDAKVICHNPSLGLVTKARACKSAREEGGLGDTYYTPGNAGKCGRMNPHTPKVTPTWGVEFPKDSRIFRERLQESKPMGLNSSLYHCKVIET
jgi:hypothetical protein